MTNDVNARARKTPIGWVGELRKVRRSDWELVAENGIPIIFATEHEAEIAAWRALRSHLVGEVVGTGDKASMALSVAEEKFGKLLRGGGKTIAVERR